MEKGSNQQEKSSNQFRALVYQLELKHSHDHILIYSCLIFYVYYLSLGKRCPTRNDRSL